MPTSEAWSPLMAMRWAIPVLVHPPHIRIQLPLVAQDHGPQKSGLLPAADGRENLPARFRIR